MFGRFKSNFKYGLKLNLLRLKIWFQNLRMINKKKDLSDILNYIGSDEIDWATMQMAAESGYADWTVFNPTGIRMPDKYLSMDASQKIDYLRSKAIPFALLMKPGCTTFMVQLIDFNTDEVPVVTKGYTRSMMSDRPAKTFNEAAQVIWDWSHEIYSKTLSESLYTVAGLTDTVLGRDGKRVKIKPLCELVDIIPIYEMEDLVDHLAGGDLPKKSIKGDEVKHLADEVAAQFYADCIDWKPTKYRTLDLAMKDIWNSPEYIIRMGESAKDYAFLDTPNLAIAVSADRSTVKVIILKLPRVGAISVDE